MTSAEPSIEGYQLRLPAFEGPLDVLLGLIERERLAVSDVSLVAVTDGFVAYLRELVDAPPTLLAEFVGIAARLLLLKSRALLPRPGTLEDEPDLDDLAERLREYQQAKHVATELRAAEQRAWRSFARAASVAAGPPRVTLLAPPPAQLRRAFIRMLARSRPEPAVAPLRPQVSIGAMLTRLRRALTDARFPLPFQRLVGGEREELVAGFIALLTLWRRGEVEATQAALFGDILVTYSAPAWLVPDEDPGA